MSRGKPSKAGRRYHEARETRRPTCGSQAPRPPDKQPAVPERRRRWSHVLDDGTPKQVMGAEEATEAARRFGLVAYICSEKPEHYHIGRATDGK